MIFFGISNIEKKLNTITKDRKKKREEMEKEGLKKKRVTGGEIGNFILCGECSFSCPKKYIEKLESKQKVLACYENKYVLVKDYAKCPECQNFSIPKEEDQVRKVKRNSVS